MNPASLNMENIEDILNSMSSEDIDMLKNAAQDIFSAMGEKNSKKEKTVKQEKKESSGIFDGFSPDIETIGKIMSLMEKLGRRLEDPRCTLLLSLKPMLSKRRQDKVDDAVKIISLLALLPFIEELGGK